MPFSSCRQTLALLISLIGQVCHPVDRYIAEQQQQLACTSQKKRLRDPRKKLPRLNKQKVKICKYIEVKFKKQINKLGICNGKIVTFKFVFKCFLFESVKNVCE